MPVFSSATSELNIFGACADAAHPAPGGGGRCAAVQRTTRRVQLTLIGELLLPRARGILR